MKVLDIDRVGNELNWTAMGALFDRNSDDPFEFCYVYTVIAWNGSAIGARVDNQDLNMGDPIVAPFYNAIRSNGDTALISLPSYRKPPEAQDGDQIGILPRGFFFMNPTRDDRHLLQLSFHLDHNEIFLEKGKDHHWRHRRWAYTPRSMWSFAGRTQRGRWTPE